MATLLELRQADTAKQVTVMQAFIEGKGILARHLESGGWHVTKYPVWNWNEFDYKVQEDEVKE